MTHKSRRKQDSKKRWRRTKYPSQPCPYCDGEGSVGPDSPYRSGTGDGYSRCRQCHGKGIL